MTLQFEDVLKTVGDFGRYQITLVCIFLIPSVTVIPWFSMNVIFMSSTPDHWCRVPEIEKFNISHKEKMLLIRPPNNPCCSTYDINFTALLKSPNWTIDEDWPTRPCIEGYEYDITDYDATAASRWNMVCENSLYSSMVVSLMFVGNVIGSPFFGCLPDRVGRKTTFLLMALLTGITEIVSVLVPNFTAFLVLRTINGSSGSTIYIVSYIMLLELVGTGLRTRMNALTTGAWTCGLCLLPLGAYLSRNWIILSITCCSSAFALLLYWKILPESPRWLLSQERYEEAHEIMISISKTNGAKGHESNDLLDKLKRIGEQLKEEKTESGKHSPLDLLKYPQLRKKFLLLTFCWIANSLAYFGLQVNVKNLVGSEHLNFFLLSVVEFPAHAAAWYGMQRVGRRWCSVVSLAISSIACMVQVILLAESTTLGVIASVFGKLGSSAAFMTLYQQAPELYPTPIRGIGMSVSASIGTAVSLTAPYIADLSAYGKHLPFLLFSVVNICASLCASLLPETLDRELPQTIADSENFGSDQKFCSCGGGRRSSDAEGGGMNGIKNMAFSKESINGKLYAKRNSHPVCTTHSESRRESLTGVIPTSASTVFTIAK